MPTVTFSKNSSNTYAVNLLGEQVGTLQVSSEWSKRLKTWSVVINGKSIKDNAGDTEFTLTDAKKRATQHAQGLLLRSLQPLSRAAVAAVNRALRESDQSHLAPINGRFNATERAIRRLRDYRLHHEFTYVAEYMAALEQEISHVVNNSL